jgi:hypothetical protein
LVTQDNVYSVIAFAAPRVIEELMSRRSIDQREAAALLYGSKLYGSLENEGTKLWHLGTVTLTLRWS